MSKLEKITIRKAVLDDLFVMLQLMDDILGNPFESDELKQQFERWSSRFEKNSSFLHYVAENEQKKIIGWSSGRKTLESHLIANDQSYDCEVGHMFVHQEYQHRGIGQELWRIVWNAIIERFHPTNLIVWGIDKEQAHRFYRSLEGTPVERKNMNNAILTAYVWKDLQPYDSINFVLFK